MNDPTFNQYVLWAPDMMWRVLTPATVDTPHDCNPT